MMPNEVTVEQVDNNLTVVLTEWLIMHDFFDEEGPVDHQQAMGDFGALCDQLFARHRIAAEQRGREECEKVAAKAIANAIRARKG